ncbi:unnamed protein product [Hermetia illucens]|uniref:HTH psq-type domain-containing protein n=1 Tax=Hermetia illucens TaxID=343691 RepID=A0A7R8YW29_HERIL|nr:unnamed protein product [Hermetia illucens]
MIRKKALTIEEKLKIISAIENGQSQANICREKNLPKSTVSNIWNSDKKIESELNCQIDKKKLRTSLHPKVDTMWFQQKKANTKTISSIMLMLKTEKFGRAISAVVAA